jgi:hypothetical protein
MYWTEYEKLLQKTQAVTNNPAHAITTPELLYVQFIPSYYTFRSFVPPSPGRKNATIQRKNDTEESILYLNLLNLMILVSFYVVKISYK